MDAWLILLLLFCVKLFFSFLQEKRREKEKQKNDRLKAKEDKQAQKARENLLKNVEKERKKQFGLIKDCLNVSGYINK